MGGKAGRKDLVHDFVPGPLGQAEHFLFPEILGTVKHIVNVRDAPVKKAVFPIIAYFSGGIFYFKKVSQTDHVKLFQRLVIVAIIVGVCQLHGAGPPSVLVFEGQVFILDMQDYPCRVPLFGFKPYQKAPLFQGKTVSFVCKMPDCRVFHVSCSSLL